jgi:hypothetical protein
VLPHCNFTSTASHSKNERTFANRCNGLQHGSKYFPFFWETIEIMLQVLALAHPHRESARQDLDGMSGAIVIEGIDRYYPELRATCVSA